MGSRLCNLLNGLLFLEAIHDLHVTWGYLLSWTQFLYFKGGWENKTWPWDFCTAFSPLLVNIVIIFGYWNYLLSCRWCLKLHPAQLSVREHMHQECSSYSTCYLLQSAATMSSGNAKIGQPAPDFSATAVVKGQFETIKLGDYKGNCGGWFLQRFRPTGVWNFSLDFPVQTCAGVSCYPLFNVRRMLN